MYFLHTAGVPIELTSQERRALAALLPELSGDVDEDLFAAMRRTWEVRLANSEYGGQVVAALHREYSWRYIERRTGIDQSTLRSWAAKLSEREEED